MTVSASFCMSLDGFVASPDDNVGPLFDWYTGGDVEVPWSGYPITFKVSAADLERVEVVAGDGVTHLRYRVRYRVRYR